MSDNDPIVVGMDGTPAGARALRWALREARVRGLPVLAVAACPVEPGSRRPGAVEARMRVLSSALHDCLAGTSFPELRAELVEGRPADVLVARSDAASMLVLGDRGRQRWDAEPLGGTAWECIRRARCPVLVVPAERGREPEGVAAVNDPVLG